MKPIDGIEVYQPKSSPNSSPKRSQPNGMERWDELIAGFVLGNLTPEEAESVAKVLADNPQLASHIARLRNTATVRALGKTEWSTARSQDGSEGWADTTLDLQISNLQTSNLETSFHHHLSANAPGDHLKPNRVVGAIAPATAAKVQSGSVSQQSTPPPTFKQFSRIEALLVPLSNPLWWAAIAFAVAVGIDDYRVRRSLQDALKELSQLQATPQYIIQDPANTAK